MRFLTLPLLAGVALANPVAELQARQLNPSQSSCSVSHTGSCRSTLLSSARTFCASLGFGTTVSTILTTNVINRTIVKTFSATVATRTITAPAVTSTSTSVRTLAITQTQTARSTSTVTERLTDSVTGTIESCPGYTPQQTAHSDVDLPSDPATTAPATTASPTTTPASGPAGGGSTSTSSPTTTIPPEEVAGPQVTNGAYNGCPASNMTVLTFAGGANMQVLCGDLEDSSPVVRSVRRDLVDCASACIAANSAGTRAVDPEDQQGLNDVCKGVTFVESGMDAKWCYFKQWTSNTRGFRLWPYGRTTQGIPQEASIVSAQRIQHYYNEAYPIGYGVDSMAAKRAVSPVKPRQAAPVKPACLRATNAVQTTSACNCVIPSSTVTVRSTSASVITNLRTISTTLRITATTTATPTVRTSITRTTTLTRVRTITSWSGTTTTEHTTSTVAWSLVATPSAFYIVDADMAFAEWPADADEIFYHVQYDWDQTDDEYAPTVFTITGSGNDELRVANMEDDNGPAEGYLVAGQEYDGPGFQLVAQENAAGMPVPACLIQVTADGKCPLKCNLGLNDVNARNSDGLWSLLPNGTDGGFENFIMAADVDLEARRRRK